MSPKTKRSDEFTLGIKTQSSELICQLAQVKNLEIV